MRFSVLISHSSAGPAGDGDSNTKTSLAYIQLEKQNERLKEALIRCVVDSCLVYFNSSLQTFYMK